MKTLTEEMQTYRKMLDEDLVHQDLYKAIENGIRHAKKDRNATELFYYLQLKTKYNRGELLAFNDYNTWINSWSGVNWLKKYYFDIKKLVDQENSLSWMPGAKADWMMDKMSN